MAMHSDQNDSLAEMIIKTVESQSGFELADIEHLFEKYSAMQGGKCPYFCSGHNLPKHNK